MITPAEIILQFFPLMFFYCTLKLVDWFMSLFLHIFFFLLFWGFCCCYTFSSSHSKIVLSLALSSSLACSLSLSLSLSAFTFYLSPAFSLFWNLTFLLLSTSHFLYSWLFFFLFYHLFKIIGLNYFCCVKSCGCHHWYLVCTLFL
jgi:hypothetical protein